MLRSVISRIHTAARYVSNEKLVCGSRGRFLCQVSEFLGSGARNLGFWRRFLLAPLVEMTVLRKVR